MPQRPISKGESLTRCFHHQTSLRGASHATRYASKMRANHGAILERSSDGRRQQFADADSARDREVQLAASGVMPRLPGSAATGSSPRTQRRHAIKGPFVIVSYGHRGSRQARCCPRNVQPPGPPSKSETPAAETGGRDQKLTTPFHKCDNV